MIFFTLMPGITSNTFLKVKFSTISIAEYCVKGRIDELPLRNLEIISFNLEHAIKTAEFADVLFRVNRVSEQKIYPRAIIPNDSKLFAQADLDQDIRYFVTSDSRLKSIYANLNKRINTKFMFLDITIPYHDLFCIP